jgi:hypothetical protein
MSNEGVVASFMVLSLRSLERVKRAVESPARKVGPQGEIAVGRLSNISWTNWRQIWRWLI